jgi:NTP pyrophosphatase (non-canonical NTP hydrolase)
MLLDFPDQLVRALFSRPSAFYQDPRPVLDGRNGVHEPAHDHGPLLHAVIGLAGESGELIDTVKKAWAYNQPLDKSNLVEELGDTAFYWLAACLEGGVHPQTVLDQMVAKLKVRYPAGSFNAADAAERKDKS